MREQALADQLIILDALALVEVLRFTQHLLHARDRLRRERCDMPGERKRLIDCFAFGNHAIKAAKLI